MKDISDTPNISPVTLADSSNLKINIPKRAATITIYTSVSLYFGIESDDVEGTGNGYSLIPLRVPITKGIADLEYFHLRNESGASATIYFDFSLI
jgi:hypothetical protein